MMINDFRRKDQQKNISNDLLGVAVFSLVFTKKTTCVLTAI